MCEADTNACAYGVDDCIWQLENMSVAGYFNSLVGEAEGDDRERHKQGRNPWQCPSPREAENRKGENVRGPM